MCVCMCVCVCVYVCVCLYACTVAESVAAASPHTVGGRQLEVAVARPEDHSAPSTVIIRNCDLENKDLYMLYFENPKKGGGEIKDFVVDKNQGAILITFEDPEGLNSTVLVEIECHVMTMLFSLFSTFLKIQIVIIVTIMTLKGTIEDFCMSPRCAGNCLRHTWPHGRAQVCANRMQHIWCLSHTTCRVLCC